MRLLERLCTEGGWVEGRCVGLMSQVLRYAAQVDEWRAVEFAGSRRFLVEASRGMRGSSVVAGNERGDALVAELGWSGVETVALWQNPVPSETVRLLMRLKVTLKEKRPLLVLGDRVGVLGQDASMTKLLSAVGYRLEAIDGEGWFGLPVEGLSHPARTPQDEVRLEWLPEETIAGASPGAFTCSEVVSRVTAWRGQPRRRGIQQGLEWVTKRGVRELWCPAGAPVDVLDAALGCAALETIHWNEPHPTEEALQLLRAHAPARYRVTAHARENLWQWDEWPSLGSAAAYLPEFVWGDEESLGSLLFGIVRRWCPRFLFIDGLVGASGSWDEAIRQVEPLCHAFLPVEIRGMPAGEEQWLCGTQNVETVSDFIRQYDAECRFAKTGVGAVLEPRWQVECLRGGAQQVARLNPITRHLGAACAGNSTNRASLEAVAAYFSRVARHRALIDGAEVQQMVLPFAKLGVDVTPLQREIAQATAPLPAPTHRAVPRVAMLTTAKPFRGHFGIIQRNALRSWAALVPQPEIYLFGDEEGSAEIANELGLIHLPTVERSSQGAPLVSAMFATVRERSEAELLCFSNADIVLLPEFTAAVAQLWRSMRTLDRRLVLLSSRRREIDQETEVDVRLPEHLAELRLKIERDGIDRESGAVDLFLFSRELFTRMPELVVGRAGWDHWCTTEAVAAGAIVVDASPCFQLIHQNHDYSHLDGGEFTMQCNAEAKHNAAHNRRWGGSLHSCATHVLRWEGLQPYDLEENRDYAGRAAARLRLAQRVLREKRAQSAFDFLRSVSREAPFLEPRLASATVTAFWIIAQHARQVVSGCQQLRDDGTFREALARFQTPQDFAAMQAMEPQVGRESLYATLATFLEPWTNTRCNS